ncbi:MAG: NAD-dependent epimerase/dehydratase family protein [Polyangiales bacterium]
MSALRVTVIGAEGFVGSAFVRHLRAGSYDVAPVTRATYREHAGKPSDVVIDAACNSKKFLADRDPFAEFELSVSHRLHTLRDFPAKTHVHISSVDVYSDLTSPSTTREDSPIDLARQSHYGFNKLLAEQLVRHHAERWLILRLAGMVGPGLRKNPVYDLLNGQPLRIHPDSQYQFMRTDDVAAIAWQLIREGISGEALNVCGAGLISPREIAALLGRELDLSALEAGAKPRIVEASTEKLSRVARVPTTRDAVTDFVNQALSSPRNGTP